MAAIEVVLDLPDQLAHGLATGELVRMGGVVRRASDKAIVAHLREAGLVASNTASALTVGLSLVQIAGIAVVERHLNRIEARIEELATVARQGLAASQRIEKRQWTEIGKDFERAIQFLKQHVVSENPDDLKAARSALIECRSGVRHQIGMSTIDDLLGLGIDTEWLLRLDLDCAAAEVHVFSRCGDRGAAEAQLALQEHKTTFFEFQRKLESLPPIAKRLPTQEVISASPDGNPFRTAARWRTETAEVIEAIDQEIAFQKLLAEIPPLQLVEAGHSLLRWNKPLIVVRPD